MSIKVSELTKEYGTQKAISNLSFSAEKGEIVGLLGPNGAGKTTTMKILTCFMPPTAGSAEVCGLQVGTDDLEIKEKIGYLPEHNPLYGSMYIKEYLRFVERLHKLPKNRNRVADLTERVGLSREQHKKISQLSKGYKQRVGLAQALIHDPEVLILDEPISGLDPNQLVEIRELISTLKKDKTVIFSSHILQEVESICDKVVILDQGQLVADDTLSGLGSAQADRSVEIAIELWKEMDAMKLQYIGSVVRVEKKGPCRYNLTTTEDVRAEIFDVVAKEGNKLLGMQVEKSSLEQVFKDVTQNK